MRGVAPHMCDQVARPLSRRGAGGRSPGYLGYAPSRQKSLNVRRQGAADRRARDRAMAKPSEDRGIGPLVGHAAPGAVDYHQISTIAAERAASALFHTLPRLVLLRSLWPWKSRKLKLGNILGRSCPLRLP